MRKDEKLMKLTTKYLGELEVDEKKMIDFPNGLPGFPEEKSFIILELPNNDAFQLLQSTKTEDLAFVIANPHFFYTDYELKLEDDLLQTLQIATSEDVLVSVIVTLQKPFKESTINLRAPIIINSTKLIGKQYILNDNNYSSRASLMPKQEENESCSS
jgi:flagellar assembly factor FliW